MEPKRWRDLIRLFGAIQGLHEQLFTVVQAKIDAMRRADTAALRNLNVQEHAVVERVREREDLRQQLLGAIGRDSGWPASTVQSLTVTQVASRVPPPLRTELLEAAQQLREAVFRVARVNRVAGAVSREILSHLRWVFASACVRDDPPAGYSGSGAPVGGTETRVFETVG